jgi:hypothetical protein
MPCTPVGPPVRCLGGVDGRVRLIVMSAVSWGPPEPFLGVQKPASIGPPLRMLRVLLNQDLQEEEPEARLVEQGCGRQKVDPRY